MSKNAGTTLIPPREARARGDGAPLVVAEHFGVAHEQQPAGAVRVRIESSEATRTVIGESVQRSVEVRRVARDVPVSERRDAWREGDTIVVPIYEERLVVHRELVLTEEIHLKVDTNSQPQAGDVRLRQECAVVERQRSDGSWQVVTPSEHAQPAAPRRTPSSPVASRGSQFQQQQQQETNMRQTVVGVFDRYEAARQAAARLEDSGFGPDSVHITTAEGEDEGAEGASLADTGTSRDTGGGVMDGIRNFFAGIFGSDDDDARLSTYAEAMKRGGTIVRVDVEDEPRVELARETLAAAGAVNIEERVAQWRQSGWEPGMGEPTSRPRVSPIGDGGSVGSNDGGKVVLTSPLNLKQGAAATGSTFGAGAAARTDERIDEGFDESLDERAGATDRTLENLDSEFRAHYESTYAPDGGQYADYEPAYHYGHSLAADERYADSDWDTVESNARSDWEQRYPGSTWERFKAAVRRGWERTSD